MNEEREEKISQIERIPIAFTNVYFDFVDIPINKLSREKETKCVCVFMRADANAIKMVCSVLDMIAILGQLKCQKTMGQKTKTAQN